jgi:hypothetical protein
MVHKEFREWKVFEIPIYRNQMSRNTDCALETRLFLQLKVSETEICLLLCQQHTGYLGSEFHLSAGDTLLRISVTTGVHQVPSSKINPLV